jgi:hypothetical protein
MKIVLIFLMCSFAANECAPPLRWPETFDDPYSCSVAGYEEATRKLKEIGREEVNKLGLSITFTCNLLSEANT